MSASRAALPPDLRKASGFPPDAQRMPPELAGRLSLPASSGVIILVVQRKGRAFPRVGRQSRKSVSTLTSVIWMSLRRCMVPKGSTRRVNHDGAYGRWSRGPTLTRSPVSKD
jgi:hypothetical protein